MEDCFTCEFAKRDKHNKFEDRCSGFSNCSYSKFQGKIFAHLKQISFINMVLIMPYNLLMSGNQLNKITLDVIFPLMISFIL